MVRNVLNYALNGGVTPELVNRHRKNIAENNLRAVSLVCNIACLACLIMSLIYRASFEQTANMLLFCSGVMLVFVLLCLLFRKASLWVVNALSYACIGALIGFACAIDALAFTDYPAVLFCVMLAMLPMMIFDKPWHIYLFCLCFAVLFLILSASGQSGEVHTLNMVNITCFYLLGSALARVNVQRKIRELTMKDQLRRQRDTDSLTKLLNKDAAEKLIAPSLINPARPGALMLISIKNYKRVCDNISSPESDPLLQALANLLENAAADTEHACRLGGDDFIVYLSGMQSKDAVREKAVLLMHEAKRLPKHNNPEMQVAVNVGIALFPKHGTNFSALYNRADQALYTAKAMGNETYSLFANTVN